MRTGLRHRPLDLHELEGLLHDLEMEIVTETHLVMIQSSFEGVRILGWLFAGIAWSLQGYNPYRD
jgi:hypothetical protein